MTLPITDAACCIRDAIVEMLDRECGRERPSCTWVSTNPTPGVGCCDAILVRNSRIENLAPAGIRTSVAKFRMTFDVKVTRCKPAIDSNKDSLSVDQEEGFANEVLDERWVLANELMGYLISECGSCSTIRCAEYEVSTIESYDDAFCSGHQFTVRFVAMPAE